MNKARTELIYARKLEYSIIETRKTAEENIEFGEDFGGITDLEDLVGYLYSISYHGGAM